MAFPQRLVIRQKVEAMEIFTGFETKNRYQVCTEQGQPYLYAYEEGNFLLRQILKTLRPFKITVLDNNKQPIITIERGFFFIRANHTVKRADGSILGYIKQKFMLFNMEFDVYDKNMQHLFTVYMKFPHWWTYNLLKNGQEVGRISKKWTGTGKEFFTDADNFLVDFGQITKPIEQYLVLASAFAIDVRRFERK